MTRRMMETMLEASGCAPACRADHITAIRTRFLVSDILLAVGSIAISGAPEGPGTEGALSLTALPALTISKPSPSGR